MLVDMSSVLTWSAEGGREEVLVVQVHLVRPDLDTGGVVAAGEAAAMLHHPVQAVVDLGAVDVDAGHGEASGGAEWCQVQQEGKADVLVELLAAGQGLLKSLQGKA